MRDPFVANHRPDYRGHWCPFCIAYIKSLQAIVPSIEQANGTPIIITAEDEEHLAATLASTGYTGNTINDPDNLVAQKLKDLGKVNVVISDKSGYPNGMAQPALLIMRKDGDVLYSWAIEPSLVSLSRASKAGLAVPSRIQLIGYR